jgi:cell wall-associated NlpC family hydrolase
MSHWATQYIGLPWVAGQDGPDAFDCWGFFRHVQRVQFGREVPAVEVRSLHAGAVRQTLKEHKYLGWARVENPREGDAVLMPRFDEVHIGIWLEVNKGGVLHCARGFGVVMQSQHAIRLDGWTRFEFWRAG